MFQAIGAFLIFSKLGRAYVLLIFVINATFLPQQPTALRKRKVFNHPYES